MRTLPASFWGARTKRRGRFPRAMAGPRAAEDAAPDVDAYVEKHLLADDPALDAALAAMRGAGLPMIQVAPVQGKMLMLLARAIRAERVLEVGTLGGYSTIWLARALPRDGRLVTLEIDPKHAAVARANLARAGLADRVEVRVGPAVETLKALAGPFDFAFIDADKPSNVPYFEHALRLVRSGGIIVVDNVIREGEILDAASADERVRGTQRLFERVAREPRVDATAVQTVGSKKWDGFLLAWVKE